VWQGLFLAVILAVILDLLQPFEANLPIIVEMPFFGCGCGSGWRRLETCAATTGMDLAG